MAPRRHTLSPVPERAGAPVEKVLLMTRRTPTLLAVGALAAISALVASSADAAGQHPLPLRSGPHAPEVRIQSRAAAAATSLAVFGAGPATFQVATGVSGRKAQDSAQVAISGSAVASSVNTAGNDGLLCGQQQTIYPVTGLLTTPALQGTGINASAYTGEGGSGYGFFCYGVAVHGRAGLATGDSQGLLQLIRKHGVWKIDKRVQFPGVNDAGQPHQPGWIDFKDSTTPATLFNTAVIAPKAMADGKLLAVTLDRENGENTAVVVSGVGTATPRAVGALKANLLGDPAGNQQYGTGAFTFVPGSPDEALVATNQGFAILDAHRPAHPRLRDKRTIAATSSSSDPASLSVSPDGDHVAVALGGRVYVYRNVHRAVTKGRPFHYVTSFKVGTGTGEAVTDVAFTANGTLVVLHSSITGSFVTVVKKATTANPVVKGSTAVNAPDYPGSLSVWPAS